MRTCDVVQCNEERQRWPDGPHERYRYCEHHLAMWLKYQDQFLVQKPFGQVLDTHKFDREIIFWDQVLWPLWR